MQTLSTFGIVDFGETENDEAYAISLTANSVYHISSGGPLPETLVDFSGNLNANGVILSWQTAFEQNTLQF